MSDDLRNLIERYDREHDSRAFAPLADAYRKQGDVDKAIELLERGIERFPNYASAHIILGKCFYDTGATERAKAEFRRVLELDAENMVALKFLGDILLAEERRKEAAECYRRLLAIDPMNEDVLRALKEIENPFIVKEIDLGDSKTARDERPRELATITLAGIYAAQGYYNKALGIYRDVLSREPSNREAQEMAGKLQAMLESTGGEREEPLEGPVLSISLEDIGDEIAASTAGRGGEESAKRAEPPAEAMLPSDASLAGIGAGGGAAPAETSPERTAPEKKPTEPAEPKREGAEGPPKAESGPDAGMEQFRSWLKKTRGR